MERTGEVGDSRWSGSVPYNTLTGRRKWRRKIVHLFLLLRGNKKRMEHLRKSWESFRGDYVVFFVYGGPLEIMCGM